MKQMTKEELMAILNDPNKPVACFMPDREDEVSRDEFKAWLEGKGEKKEGAES